MAKTIRVEIVTPEKIFLTDDVNMVIARTTGGDIGILPGHAPLIAGLDIWVLRLLRDEGEQQLALCGGMIEVKPDKVTILASCAENPEEIDVMRAEAARARAEKRLQPPPQSGVDVARAEFALKRALLRLKLAEKGHKR